MISRWRDGRLPLRLLLTFTLFPCTFPLLYSCGLDWTLPQAHFEGVDELGYVAYWEKIGEADLGDGLVIPVNIGFNSHREASSPTLGKGWILPLLESHVEPVDENTLHVIMPDGWTFLFLRNGNTDTWRGNSGWVGQTDGSRFTITAPCGWRIKYDAGKIQEIDSPKNRTITIKYNGPDPVEADIDNQPFVQVDPNPATGVAQDITIAGQKISISQAQRPSIRTVLGKTLLTGFDPALSQLQWPDGSKETFNFAAPQSLTPSLAITKSNQPHRLLTWDPGTSQIKTDGQWAYHFTPSAYTVLNRTDAQGHSEFYSRDPSTGTTITQGLDGVKIITRAFTTVGPLKGMTRSVTQVENGKSVVVRKFAYDEKGRIIREIVGGPKPQDITFKYNNKGEQTEIDLNGKLAVKNEFDAQGRLICKTFSNGIKETYAYATEGVDQTTHFSNGETLVAHFSDVVTKTAQKAVLNIENNISK